MDYKKLVKPYQKEMIDILIEWLKIDSIYDESTIQKGMPFGKGVYNALQFIGKVGENQGYKVDYCDGYATELTIGSGKKLISIFAHADVVPVSGEWDNPPFEPVIKDGNLYARGSSDDKGPLIAALYAAKALKDNGMINDYRLRFVIGGDEERGSGCLVHYFEKLHKEEPTFGFTPDSDFPLIYGEKGITDFYPSWNINIPHVKSISGGVASNAVCDKCVVELDDAKEFIEFLKKENVEFESRGNVVIFIGQSCHGSTPHLGKNAALISLINLGKFYKVEKLVEIGEKLSETSGKLFGGFISTKLLGETTYCIGLISYENEKLSITVNFRYPEKVDQFKMIDNFDKVFGSKSTCKESSPNLLYDPECTLVKTLLKAYREETGDMTPPLTTGGGTYAKHAKNTVAFGALFQGRESTMHEPNELIPLEDIFKSAEIYAHAIDLLGKAE